MSELERRYWDALMWVILLVMSISLVIMPLAMLWMMLKLLSLQS